MWSVKREEGAVTVLHSLIVRTFSPSGGLWCPQRRDGRTRSDGTGSRRRCATAARAPMHRAPGMSERLRVRHPDGSSPCVFGARTGQAPARSAPATPIRYPGARTGVLSVEWIDSTQWVERFNAMGGAMQRGWVG